MLQTLWLGDNNIGADGAKEIAAALKVNTSLTELCVVQQQHRTRRSEPHRKSTAGELNPHRSRYWQERHRTTRCAVNSRCYQGDAGAQALGEACGLVPEKNASVISKIKEVLQKHYTGSAEANAKRKCRMDQLGAGQAERRHKEKDRDFQLCIEIFYDRIKKRDRGEAPGHAQERGRGGRAGTEGRGGEGEEDEEDKEEEEEEYEEEEEEEDDEEDEEDEEEEKTDKEPPEKEE
eukprot:g36025.t1